MRERELAMGTVLLLNLIHSGEVTITMQYKGSPPGKLTPQTQEGFGMASAAMRVAYGITEKEIEAFTNETLRKHERTH